MHELLIPTIFFAEAWFYVTVFFSILYGKASIKDGFLSIGRHLRYKKYSEISMRCTNIRLISISFKSCTGYAFIYSSAKMLSMGTR